jgi:hypothetical protein
MRNDDRRGVALQRHLYDFPWMYAGAVDGAAKEFLAGNQVMTFREYRAANTSCSTSPKRSAK